MFNVFNMDDNKSKILNTNLLMKIKDKINNNRNWDYHSWNISCFLLFRDSFIF